MSGWERGSALADGRGDLAGTTARAKQNKNGKKSCPQEAEKTARHGSGAVAVTFLWEAISSFYAPPVICHARKDVCPGKLHHDLPGSVLMLTVQAQTAAIPIYSTLTCQPRTPQKLH